ncbi:MAG TPA: LptE family protein [Thermoanaerobaculia bacterium]
MKTRRPLRALRGLLSLRFLALTALAALPMLQLAGCGYALVGRGNSLPADIKQVYLKPLENRTPRSQIEQYLTRAIADEMVKRRRFNIIATPQGEDADLSGAVVAFGATPVTFDASGRATQYEISFTVQIVFKRRGADKPIWSNSHYSFRESYPIDVSQVDYFDRENATIQKAAQQFAPTMVSDLLEGF